MRRTALTTSILATTALVALGAQQTCGTLGPAAKTFAAGSLVIPMDNCYQRRDTNTVSPPKQTVACNVTRDDGVFRAYGLVYFLLKHGITVYWAIDGATPKTTVTGLDITVPHPASGAVVKRWDWGTGAVADYVIPGCTSTTCGFPPGTDISYVGGPYVIDAADAPTALALLRTDPDFARFRTEAIVDVHEVQNGFTAAQVRPLTGPPPKLAILASPASGKKTSVNVMYQYAVAAGLSWPCHGDGDCAGGLAPGCKLTDVINYLHNPAGDAAIPTVCDPNDATLCAPNFNTGAATAYDLYDVLCDDDFVPPSGGTYGDTSLAKGSYKLLWIPHWDTSYADPTATPPTAASQKLASELSTIATYVDAGNNLFVECYGIMALEGVHGESSNQTSLYGIPATRFHATAGIFNWNGSGTLQAITDEASHPDLQVGDFTYVPVSGAITTFYPDHAATPASLYRDGQKRLLTELNGSTPWDVAGTIQVAGNDGAPRGTVAYLGGHDYSPTADWGATTPTQHADSGKTAGTRIVLNTLFNLGFGCADPNPPQACQTGGFGECAIGTLKCATGGGYHCVGPAPGPKDLCDGKDENCNGIVDDDCNPPACQNNATQSCYDGPAGTAGAGRCTSGSQTCTGGLWGACQGQVLPTPEVCNGVDDDCNGQVDDGDLCDAGSHCVQGACLPDVCVMEGAGCPNGFTCDYTSQKCVKNPCPGATGGTCPDGQICGGAQGCVDPCAGVQCGAGASCSGGQCVAGGCARAGCATPGQVCIDGACVDDPCAGAKCPTGTFCRLGDCVRSCAVVECAAGQACSVDGFCESPCSPACAAGQSCVAGACQPDPCYGVTCGSGQECSAGVCVDIACAHIQCPVGICQDGQCHSTTTTTRTETAAPTVASTGAVRGGGCASGGPGDLAGLGLLGGLFLLRRARRPVRRSGVARAALALAAGAVLLTATACSSGGGGGTTQPPVTTCDTGLTACGGSCVDTAASTANCGACGHACASGFSCSGGGCALDTGNPYVLSVSPAVVGMGSRTTLTVTGHGFKAGAKVRVNGPGIPAGLVLDPAAIPSDGSLTVVLQLDQGVTGIAELRVLNPNPDPAGLGRLVSNPARITINQALLLRGVQPQPSVRQDQAPLDLQLAGFGFVSGAVATLRGPAGGTATTVTLTTVYVDGGQLNVTGVDPKKLAVGVYDLQVVNPGGATSAALKFSVTEGAPVVTQVTPTCITTGTQAAAFTGVVTGSYLYPTSVVRVSGGVIQDSVLDTRCQFGTDALGQCQGGSLLVSANLTGVPANTYQLAVVNPGSPSPQRSASTDVKLAATCP